MVAGVSAFGFLVKLNKSGYTPPQEKGGKFLISFNCPFILARIHSFITHEGPFFFSGGCCGEYRDIESVVLVLKEFTVEPLNLVLCPGGHIAWALE